MQVTVVPLVTHRASAAPDPSNVPARPSATAELLPSKNFRATHASNDRARIRLARIALRGGRYASFRFLSLTGTELAPRPSKTGPNSVRLSNRSWLLRNRFAGADRGDESMHDRRASNKKKERDDDSKKSRHHAPGWRRLLTSDFPNFS
jgi:hypothetical protein